MENWRPLIVSVVSVSPLVFGYSSQFSRKE